MWLAFAASVLLHGAVFVRLVDRQGSSLARDDVVPVHVQLVRTEVRLIEEAREGLISPVPASQNPVEATPESAPVLRPDTAAPAAVTQPEAAPSPPTPVPRETTPAPLPLAPVLPSAPPLQQPALAPPTPAAATGGSPPPTPPTAYQVAGALNPPPRLISDVNTEDTPVSEDGQVVVRVLIDETGRVADVLVLRSYPKGRYEAAAKAAFISARYSPGYLSGKAVKSQVTYEINYSPTNRGASIAGQSN